MEKEDERSAKSRSSQSQSQSQSGLLSAVQARELDRAVAQYLAARGLRAVREEEEQQQQQGEGERSQPPPPSLSLGGGGGESGLRNAVLQADFSLPAQRFALAVGAGDWAGAVACVQASPDGGSAGEEEEARGGEGGEEEVWIREGVKDSLRMELLVAQFVELLAGSADSAGLQPQQQQQQQQQQQERVSRALALLRESLTPLAESLGQAERLGRLTALLLAPSAVEVLRRARCAQFSPTELRQHVLDDIGRRFLADGVLLPSHRLETLVHQALVAQISSCAFHNPATRPADDPHLPATAPLSLLSDHHCEPGQLPSVEAHVLSGAHTDEVWCCRFSHDGRLLASSGKDATVSVFELHGIETAPHREFTPRVRCVLAGHTKPVVLVAFSPDDRFLLSGSNDHDVRVWDVAAPSVAGAAADSPMPTEGDAAVDVPASGSATRSSRRSSARTSGASAADDLPPPPDSRQVLAVREHNSAVTCVAWFPDGRRFVSGGQDKSIIVHRLEEASNHSGWVATVEERWTAAAVNDLVVTPDGKQVVAACQDKKIRVFRVGFGEEDAIEESKAITSLSIARSVSAQVASGGPQQLTDSAGVFPWTAALAPSPHNNLTFSADLAAPSNASQRWQVLANQADHELHCWEIPTKRLVQTYHGHAQARYVIRSCFGGADDGFVASGSEDSIIYIWRRVDGALVLTLEGHAGAVNDVAWNPAYPGVMASSSDDRTIRIWAPSTGPSA